MPTTTAASSRLHDRLSRETRPRSASTAADRGLYATDASLYQVEPLGVVVPRTADDVAAAVRIAAEEGVPVLPRGAATSLSGQTVGAGDRDRLLEVPEPDRRRRPRPDDRPGRAGGRARPAQRPPQAARPDVRPRRLDRRPRHDRRDDRQQLGRRPVAPLRQDRRPRPRRSTSSWPTAPRRRFGPVAADDLDAVCARPDRVGRVHRVGPRRRSRAHREAIAAQFPKILRRVSGYNLDEFVPGLPVRPVGLARRALAVQPGPADRRLGGDAGGGHRRPS